MYGLEINKELSLSTSKQLEDQLREAILKGKLAADMRIPPTRNLAKDLGIARNTVIQVYEQLIAEGYLKSVAGSGTYVSDIGKLPSPNLVPNNRKVKQATNKRDVISFNAGNPDVSVFPRIQWAKMLKTACLEADDHSYTYNYYTGHPILKKAVSSYVYRVKGIMCRDDQIVIIPGAAGGLDILAKAFIRKGNKIAIEDPCIHFAKKVFSYHSYELCPVDVDSQGMITDNLKSIENLDVIYVGPSHQFPIGGVLPAARRIALLQYANEQNAYIIEDDYDSEFRYKGEALQALRNLSPERVIYIGSFSKIFTPSLRLGYMILPEQLCGRISSLMEYMNIWMNPVDQLALAEYIRQKYLDKHIYKMKKLYETKRKYLMTCLQEAFGEHIKISGEYAGIHLLVSFDRDLNENDFQSMNENGVEADFVEEYAIVKGKNLNKLVLGYGELDFAKIEEGVKRLKNAILINR